MKIGLVRCSVFTVRMGLVAGLIMQTSCSINGAKPVFPRQDNVYSSKSKLLPNNKASAKKRQLSVNAVREENLSEVKVFLIGENGKGLSSNLSGITTVRIKKSDSPVWDAPITISNQNIPPDFAGTLAYSFYLGTNDKAAVGIYVPVGFSVLKKIQDEQDCNWEQTGVPYSKRGYELYASAFSDQFSEDTLFVGGSDAGTKCLAFMLVDSTREYKIYGKVAPNLFGNYHENAFSSAMGLRNIPNNKTTTLKSSNSNDSEVSIEVSNTLGGMIQSLYLKKNASQEPIQLIQNIDAADSGIQWSAILNGVVFSDTSQHTIQTLLFNQVIGADPTWMWGMEMPLLKNSSSSLTTKENIWVPHYAETNTDQPVANQWDKKSFTPISPIFRPQALHLFDGRVEDVSLKNIILSNGHSISRVSTTFHSRTHLFQPFSANFSKKVCCSSFVRLEWMAFRRDVLVSHNAVIYYGDATGTHRIGKLDEQWEQNNSRCFNSNNQTKIYARPCGIKRLFSTNSISIVLDPETTAEQVVSIHLPNFIPFESLVEFTTASSHNNDATPKKNWTNSTFLLSPKFFNAGTESFQFTKNYDVSDTIQISIGSNADLKKINPSLGY